MSEFIDQLTDALSAAIDHALPPRMLDKGIRAVLAAMEQPSQKMIDAVDVAGETDAGGFNATYWVGPNQAREVWKAMILAELKPENE